MSKSTKDLRNKLADALLAPSFGSPSGRAGAAPQPQPLDHEQWLLNWGGAGSSAAPGRELDPDDEHYELIKRGNARGGRR